MLKDRKGRDIPDTRKWSVLLIRRILELGKDSVNVASGYSPSGPMHIGTVREVVISDYIVFLLRELGIDAKLYIFVDDLDPVTKVPSAWSSMERYRGHTICSTISRKDMEYIRKQVLEEAEMLRGLSKGCELVWSHDMYSSGRMNDFASVAIENHGRIRDRMVDTMSTAEGYLPVHGITEDGRVISEGSYVDGRLVSDSNSIDLREGFFKMGWKIDWPARWSLYSIDVEPMGKDVFVGSFGDSAWISENIFGRLPPVEFVYEYVTVDGGRKMSKSKGNFMTAREILDLTPAWNLKHWLLYKPFASREMSTWNLLKNMGKIFREINLYHSRRPGERIFEPVRYVFDGRIPTHVPVDFDTRRFVRIISYLNLPRDAEYGRVYEMIVSSNAFDYLGEFVGTTLFKDTLASSYEWLRGYRADNTLCRDIDDEQTLFLETILRKLEDDVSDEDILINARGYGRVGFLKELVSGDESCELSLGELLGMSNRKEIVRLIGETLGKRRYELIDWKNLRGI